MILAIAREGSHVSPHFGHCEGFEIVRIVDGEVVERKTLENPGHRPGFLPVFLAEKGVNLIISGGMGASAQMLFNDKGIEVYTGVQGNLDSVIDQYIQGKLVSSDSVCHDHHFEGSCHD
jgi:predicted Fe-Mo cluster-binding NifX family protein